MNALTAPPSATTPKTSATATAAGATSPTPLRIDTFIKQHLNAARSGDSSGLSATAAQARAHGFTSSANSRYAEFLAAFRAAPDQAAYYEENYPSCCFLPWAALHSVTQSLDLWVDLPQHYTGAIPPEQLPWLDMFSMQPSDLPSLPEIADFVYPASSPHLVGCRAWLDSKRGVFNPARDHFDRVTMDEMRYAEHRDLFLAHTRDHKSTSLGAFIKEFGTSLFVAAPKDAFNTDQDWRERFHLLVQNTPVNDRTPPDDPIVFRCVKGGVLVIAAWGDEAAELNKLVASLKLP